MCWITSAEAFIEKLWPHDFFHLKWSLSSALIIVKRGKNCSRRRGFPDRTNPAVDLVRWLIGCGYYRPIQVFRDTPTFVILGNASLQTEKKLACPTNVTLGIEERHVWGLRAEVRGVPGHHLYQGGCILVIVTQISHCIQIPGNGKNRIIKKKMEKENNAQYFYSVPCFSIAIHAFWSNLPRKKLALGKSTPTFKNSKTHSKERVPLKTSSIVVIIALLGSTPSRVNNTPLRKQNSLVH